MDADASLKLQQLQGALGVGGQQGMAAAAPAHAAHKLLAVPLQFLALLH